MGDESPPRIVVVTPPDPAMLMLMRSLAQRLSLPLVSEEQADPDGWRLARSSSRLELLAPGVKVGRGVSVDFGALNLRPRSRAVSRQQPLARAIGPAARTVVDATAGLGRDAFFMAAFGYDVLAIERSPALAAVLEDGLRRAGEDAALAALIVDRLRMRVGDARTLIQECHPPPDAVYVDPMFPPKRRTSALPRKEIQVIRALIGDDQDANELCRVARGIAARRVIVKRPDYAEPLDGPPDHSIEGKLARFDVYLRR